MATLNTVKVITTGESYTGDGAWVTVDNTTSGALTAGVPYLILAGARVGQDAQQIIGARLQINGVTLPGSTHIEESDSSPDVHFNYFFADIYTAAGGAETMRLQTQTWSAALTATIDNVVLLAIPLSHVEEDTDYFQSVSTSLIDLSTSWQDGASLTFTPGTAGHDWLILGVNNIVVDTDNSIEFQSRLNWSGGVTSTDPTTAREGASGGGDEVQNHKVALVRTLAAAAHTVKWQFQTSGSPSTADDVTYSAIYAFDLDTVFEKFAFESNYGDDVSPLSATAFGSELATCSLTPDTAADVLVIGAFVHDVGDTESYHTARLQVDGADINTGTTSAAQGMVRSWDAAEESPAVYLGIHESATAAAHTYDLDAGDPDTGNADDTCIVAISLVTPDTGVGPTAGTNPTIADAPTEAEIDLSWGDSPDNTETYVHRSASSGFTPIVGTRLTSDLGANETTYTDSGLDPETFYYYVVEWLDGTGSTYSAEVAGKTAPAVPVAISFDTVTSTRIDFTITPGIGASGNLHRVIVKEDGTPISTISLAAGVYTSFADGLDPGSDYVFEAQAYELVVNGGLGAYSTLFSDSPTTAPATPDAPTLTSVNDTTVVMALTAATGATSHYVHRVASGAAAPTGSGTRTSSNLGASPTSYTDSAATPETAYDYYVEAVNAGGSTFSTTWLDVTTAPARPTGISVVASGETTLTIALVLGAGASDNQQRIKYRLNGTSDTFQTLTLTAGATSGQITGLSQNTTYEITATAFDGSLESGQISSISGTTTEQIVTPPTPTVTSPLIAGDIVEDAKQISYPHTGPVMISDAAMLAFLDVLEDKVVMQIFQQAKTMLETEAPEITVSVSQNPDGYTLVQAMGYGEFILTADSDDEQSVIKIVPEMDLLDAQEPCARIISRVLYPCDPENEAWASSSTEREWFKSGDTIKYRYIPMPAKLRTLRSTLVAPAFSRAYLTAALSTQALLMNPQTSATMLQVAVQREQMLWDQLVMQIYKHNRIQSSISGIS